MVLYLIKCGDFYFYFSVDSNQNNTIVGLKDISELKLFARNQVTESPALKNGSCLAVVAGDRSCFPGCSVTTSVTFIQTVRQNNG